MKDVDQGRWGKAMKLGKGLPWKRIMEWLGLLSICITLQIRSGQKRNAFTGITRSRLLHLDVIRFPDLSPLQHELKLPLPAKLSTYPSTIYKELERV